MYEKYRKLILTVTKKEALDSLGVLSDCCRVLILTNVDVYEMMLDYEDSNQLKAPDDTSAEYITIHKTRPKQEEGDGKKRRWILAR